MYEDYVTKGGMKDFKSWCKTKGEGRWFAKQEEIPLRLDMRERCSSDGN